MTLPDTFGLLPDELHDVLAWDADEKQLRREPRAALWGDDPREFDPAFIRSEIGRVEAGEEPLVQATRKQPAAPVVVESVDLGPSPGRARRRIDAEETR